MSDAVVDPDEIIKLWRDKDFEGSYTGIKTFQTLLKLNKNIDISERKLYQILKNDPIFLMKEAIAKAKELTKKLKTTIRVESNRRYQEKAKTTNQKGFWNTIREIKG